MTPRKRAATRAATAGSTVLATTASVGEMRRTLRRKRVKAKAVPATTTKAVSPITAGRLPVGCTSHGGASTSIGTDPTARPQAAVGQGPAVRDSEAPERA